MSLRPAGEVRSSGVYSFRFLSADRQAVHAEGRRVVVKLDPRTLRPSPWTPAAREVAATLMRAST